MPMLLSIESFASAFFILPSFFFISEAHKDGAHSQAKIPLQIFALLLCTPLQVLIGNLLNSAHFFSTDNNKSFANPSASQDKDNFINTPAFFLHFKYLFNTDYAGYNCRCSDPLPTTTCGYPVSS